MSRSSVPVTVILSKTISVPLRRWRWLRRSRGLGDLCAELLESLDVHVDGTAPMAQPPGSETRARPQRATSGPRTSVEERMVLTSS
jgi:hypothetical protein